MKKLLLCLLALLPLAGCEALPFARELEATMLVQVLGVDWTAQGVALTAASDPGEGSRDSKSAVLSASGRGLAEAQAALRGAGEEYVALTHVTQLVLGKGSDLQAALEAAILEPDLGQSATVWLAAEGTAKDLLEGAGGGAKRLSSIELNSGVEPVTVLQCLLKLEEGGSVELPALSLEGETLVLAGSRALRGELYET